MTAETLTKLKIVFTGFISLKPNSSERIAATTSLGENELWSSANLYRQLLVLETLIPRTVRLLCQHLHISYYQCINILLLRQTEASAHAWIDAFFFRVSAMLPRNQRMVLNMVHAVPATTSSSSLSTLSGFVDYTAVVASQRMAGKSVPTHLNYPPYCL